MPGNDVLIGGGGFDEFIGEGGDDIMVGGEGEDHFDGGSGFDWGTYKFDRFGVTVDMLVSDLFEPPVARVERRHPGSVRNHGRAVGIGIRRLLARR